jgi:hypothetical protein
MSENYHTFIAAFVIGILLGLLFYPLHSRGQVHEHLGSTPEADQFYSTWMRPDQPGSSCCNKIDCYATEVRFVGGNIYAKRREDGEWLRIPPEKIEHNRDSPDGLSHMCAPSPQTIANSYGGYPPGAVFCFKLGGAV